MLFILYQIFFSSLNLFGLHNFNAFHFISKEGKNVDIMVHILKIY